MSVSYLSDIRSNYYEKIVGCGGGPVCLSVPVDVRGLLCPRPVRARVNVGALFRPARRRRRWHALLSGRVYLSRNLAIVVAGFVFLFRRQWQPLAVLTTAATALPVFDATVLYVALGGATRFAAHVSTFVVVGLAAVFLWLRLRNASS
jgi:hypothetical protein